VIEEAINRAYELVSVKNPGLADDVKAGFLR